MEITLLILPSGETAKIIRLEGGREFQRKLASLNLRVGKTITKITAQPFHGPLVVEVANARVTIGRGMAGKIMVEIPG